MTTLWIDQKTFSTVAPIPDRRQQSAQRRKELRMASKPTVASLCVDAHLPIDVQIIDVSRNGLGIITPCALPVGSTVVLACGALTIDGTVRHCNERIDRGYSAGISISRIVDISAGSEI